MRHYALQRVATAGIVTITAIVTARVLGPQRYGDLALFTFLVKFLLIGNLGSVSGYIFRYYHSAKDSTSCDGYLGAYLVHLVFVALVAVIVSFFLDEVYLFAALGFAVLIPYYAIEPVMRVRRRFYASLLPDVVISLAACGSLLVVMVSGIPKTSSTYLISLLALILLSYLPAMYLLRSELAMLRESLSIMNIGIYVRLVAVGVPLYLATIGFMVFLFVDRIFLEHFHTAEALGVYLLAYQLAIGATLLLTAQNFVSAIDIGEALQRNRSLRRVFRKQLGLAAVIAVPAYAGMLLIAYGLETYFLNSYDGLTRTAAALGFGLVLFFSAGSVTGLAFFKARQRVLTFGLFVLVMFALLHNVLVLRVPLDADWVSYFSGALLSAYAIFAILYTRRFL